MQHDAIRRSRRVPVRAALALLAGALVASACGGGSDASSGSDGAGDSSSGGEAASGWTYTDDLGTTVTLDEVPETIVAESSVAGGLWELGITAEGTFGPLTRPDGSNDPAIGLADPAEFTSLGEAYGQINLEKMASLEPDLIIAPTWGDNTYWGIEDSMVDQVRQIAPIIGVSVSKRPIDEVLAEVAVIAESLGADPDSTEFTNAKASFEAASEQLATATAANPDLRVLAASGTAEQMYIAVPKNYPDLSYYASLGLEVIEPDTDEEFWQTLGWEDADMYPADLIMGDARGGTPEQIVAQMPENAQQLPAVVADQLVAWQVTTALGYGKVAEVIDELAAAVQTARAGLS